MNEGKRSLIWSVIMSTREESETGGGGGGKREFRGSQIGDNGDWNLEVVRWWWVGKQDVEAVVQVGSGFRDWRVGGASGRLEIICFWEYVDMGDVDTWDEAHGDCVTRGGKRTEER